MTRRQKTTPLQDFIEVVALMPWWGGVVLAVASFALLHWLAAPVAAAPTSVQQMPSAVFGVLLKAFASIGQYVVPVICLFAAGVSAWRRHKRKTLVANVASSDAADALNDMSWQEFETTVAEAFRLDGFRVEERGGASADGGVDLVLYREREKFLVQCKQWKAYQVGVSVVRELYGVMAAEGAAGGFVVTSGKFTPSAIDFAAGRNVVLVDGAILFDMIRNARGSRVGVGV